MLNKRKIGSNNESIAIEYLKQNGYKILDKNFFTSIGEIDIIAKNDDYYVFIEVKYRKSSKYGLGYEAVNKKKQNTIMKVAEFYMYKNKIPFDSKVRFDVVSIDNDSINIFKNAFPL